MFGPNAILSDRSELMFKAPLGPFGGVTTDELRR